MSFSTKKSCSCIAANLADTKMKSQWGGSLFNRQRFTKFQWSYWLQMSKFKQLFFNQRRSKVLKPFSFPLQNVGIIHGKFENTILRLQKCEGEKRKNFLFLFFFMMHVVFKVGKNCGILTSLFKISTATFPRVINKFVFSFHE